jgi:hypothetical protein
MGSLAAFIALSMSPHVNDASDVNIFTHDGLPLLLNLLFLLSAAAMGASIMLLSAIHSELESSNFPPHHEPLYWLKLALGLTSGMLLATLFHFEQAATPETATAAMAGEVFVRFSTALVALLGGFSAQVVYRILARLSSTMEMMLTGQNGTAPELPRGRTERVAAVTNRVAGGEVDNSTPRDAQALLGPSAVRAELPATTASSSEPVPAASADDATTPGTR